MSTFKNIPSLFESRVLQHPERIAVVHGNQALSYRELNERANRIAHQLTAIPGVSGGVVGICLERSCDLMVAILAVLKAGAAYVPFDVDYPADRLEYMAAVSAIPVMLSSAALAQRLPKGNYQRLDLQQIVQDRSLEITPENPGLDIPETQAAYVLFTSGSTGQPKGVQLPHRALLNLIDWQIGQTAVHDTGRTLQFAPVSFDVHFQELFSTWCDGGCVVLIDDELRLNTEALLRYIDQQRIDRIFLPFVALQSLCELSRQTAANLASLKEVITAGEQLQVTPALVSFFERIPQCRLYNHYGPTETHVVTSYLLDGPPAAWPKLPPIGVPIQGCEIYLLDAQGQPVSDGQEGELFAAGPCLADGYLNRDELTAERFLPNPFRAGERMYKTGDLARRLPDGNLQYLGRIDGQVKVRGYRIELGEIEVALSRYPQVTLSAAAVREDKPGEKKLVAYLVMAPEQRLNVMEIRRFLQGQLPDYMMPSAFVQLPQLPRTPSGKVDRSALPAPDNKRPELGIAFIAPRTETEKRICALWSAILNIDPLGTQDNFFDLGGNSLLAIQTVALLKAGSGITLSVIKVYQHPTVAALAAEIDGASADTRGETRLKEGMQARATARHQQAETSADEAIAVVGMALRFPGAESVEAFWNNLCNGVESITFFAPGELDPSLPAELVNDPNYVPARGVLRDAKGFDAAFFNMNPNVALITDPQQRVALELAWNALEHAGYSPGRYPGLIGVFAGVGNNSYYLNNVLPDQKAVQRVGSFLAMSQNEKDYIATRIAYELNLKGLAVSVHTGCSTSLTAIVLACNALWNRECDMVLAGGAAITAPLNSGQRYEEGAMYSNDGHTRTFDDAARGTVFSDGAGMVVLKRYADALADGDTVYALVRGGALNNDGGDKGSFTAPSVAGQSAVISMAQAMAGVDAASISYVEAHGTATPIGDPIEIEGLSKAFREHTDLKQFCAVGSVKSNIGHLTAAAGVAGFMKTVLALQHREIPASLFYTQANAQIGFAETPFFVNDRLRAWDTDSLPRRAGVSSFGVGGTNAHVVLEEAPAATASGLARSRHLLMLSAKTETALDARRSELHDCLQQHPTRSMANACYTLQTGRHDFAHRWFAVVDGVDDALVQLQQADSKRSARSHLAQQGEGVVFMFPGQGSQYVGMGSVLYRDEIVFREAVDRCNAVLQPLLGRDLRELLFAAEGDADAEQLLKQTFYTQPALFTIGYSLAQLWMSWGIQPSALIGHSIGEFVAATIAEVFTLEEALTVVASRCRLMQDCPAGAMLSVRLPEEQILPLLDDTVAIAAVNGPRLCVISGPYAAVEKLQQRWEAENVVCKALQTSHAFHSPMMDAVVEPFAAAVKKIALRAPKIPILSTVTKQWLQDAQAIDPMYWAGHLRATVRFAEGVKALWSEKPHCVMLELGPRNTATTLARQQAIDPKVQKAIPSLGDSALNDAEWTHLLSAVGQLWLNGIRIDHDVFYALEIRKKIALPTYPFEHKSYWLAPPAQQAQPAQSLACNEEKITSIVSLPETHAMPQRKERLIDEITEMLEDASGMELQSADRHAGLVELGLDSLLLTQVALTLTKKYGVKVTFRQLNEDLATLNSLADYFDQRLPAEVAPVAAPTIALAAPAAQAGVAIPALPADGSLQWLIAQQMELMQKQLLAVAGQLPASALNVVAAAIQPATPDRAPAIGKDEALELQKPFGAVARIEKTASGQFSAAQARWLADFAKNYTEKTKASKAYTQQHRPHLADPRVVTGFRPHLKELIYQPVVNRSLGSKIWDIDGNVYVDILSGFGSNMFGHNAPFIVDAIGEQLKRGYELGPQHELAGEVAKIICEMTGFDRAGFCNTGSEAVLGAIRVARTVTGRSRIISFNGSYHGINDEVIVRGSKKHKPVPAAAGVMPEAVQNMLVIDYGTPESLEIIRQQAADVAAILVEPVQSRRADFQPKAFLQEVRKIATENGCLLIFDEVITGFRTFPGGAQQFYEIKADLGTYGKVIGGGMPIGVIAGKQEYMDALDGGFWQYGDLSVPEVGVTYFAGTFVRHPFALAAAKASLLHMQAQGPALQEKLNANTAWLAQEVNDFCNHHALPFHLVHFGSLFKPKYDCDLQNGDLIYLLLRHKGVHLYDGFPCFLTEAHSRDDIEFVARQFKETLKELLDLGFLPGDSAGGADDAVPPAESAKALSGSLMVVPSTEAQREIFTSVQIGGDAASCAYNESVSLRLNGPLNSALLREAFAMVLNRCDALRSSFSEDGTTFSVAANIVLPWTETSAASPQEALMLLGTCVKDEVLRPFDLSTGPLIRLHLIHLAEDSHALLMTGHHIVCDGWSLSLIIRDLGQCYSALLKDEAPALAPAVSFADYARSQEALRHDNDPSLAESYWLKQFAGEIPLVEFPPDRARPARRSFNARRIDCTVPVGVVAGLRQLSRKTNTSFVTLMLSAFEAFLYRITGQPDLVVGLPAAGQNVEGLCNLVGHCVNLLPLRTQINPAQAFTDYLRERRTALFDAYEHQQFTFGSLLQKLNVPRDPSRIPLVPVVFNVDIGFAEGFHFEGCRFEVTTNPRFFENFEVFLNASGQGDCLVLECTFNNDLFDRSVMQLRMAEFVRLLESIVADPDAPISRLDLITAEERASIEAFNKTAVPRDKPLGIHECIAQAAGVLKKNQPALIAGSESLSYEALLQRSAQFAAGLQARGLPAGALVGVCLPRILELPVALLGILQAGAAYVPLDPEFPADRLHYMMADAAASFIVTSRALQEKLQFSAPNIVFLEDLQQESNAGDYRKTPVSEDSLAYVLYTSGSTGKPKGIAVRHAAVSNLLNDLAPAMHLGNADRFLAVTTISFDISVLELFMPLMHGAEVHLASREQSIDPYWLAQYIDEKSIRFMQATPATYEMLFIAGWRGASELSVLCGGEALRIELAEKLISRCREIWNLYGPTETTIWSTAERIGVDSPMRTRNGMCTIGKPVANTRVFVMDCNGQPCPLGVAGELWIGGDGLSAGYLNLPELTREKFVPSPDGSGLVFRTGDRVQRDYDGCLYFLNRFDHQVKVRGYRIEPGEVETALNNCAEILQSVVMAVPDRSAQNILVAWFVAANSQASDAAIIAACRKNLSAQLPDYMVPSAWVRLDRLPLTPNGKINRRALPEPGVVSPVAENPSAEPLDSMQQTMHQLWCELLQVSEIRLDDNFFNLGGHSLLAVKLMVEMEKKTGKKLPLAVLFSFSTIRELAALYDNPGDKAIWNPVVPLCEVDNGKPLYFAHGISGNVFKYHALALRLQKEYSSYGLQAYGLNGTDTPFRDMKIMAAYHIAAIKKTQPTGPYRLAGGSFGGYLAYEMAVQLQAAGEVVDFLCLCDIEACKRHDFLPQGIKHLVRAGLFAERFVKRAADLAVASKDERDAYFENRKKVEQGQLYESWLDKHNMAAMIGSESTAYFKKVEEACYGALMSYKIPQYIGSILLIRAENGNYNNEYGYDLGWSNYVTGRVDVISVPGDHNSIFWEPNINELAQSIGHALQK